MRETRRIPLQSHHGEQHKTIFTAAAFLLADASYSVTAHDQRHEAAFSSQRARKTDFAQPAHIFKFPLYVSTLLLSFVIKFPYQLLSIRIPCQDQRWVLDPRVSLLSQQTFTCIERIQPTLTRIKPKTNMLPSLATFVVITRL
jgi:hypothetical protein